MKMPIPREHGAWAMLYTPFLVAFFAVGEWNWKALTVLLTLTAVFFAHEPMVLLSRAPAGSERRRYAIVWLLIYGITAMLLAFPLLWFSHLWLFIPLGLLTGWMMFVHFRIVSQKTYRNFGAELLAILSLTSSAPVLYYALRGTLDGTALLLWMLNALYFISSVFYVKMLVGRSSRRQDDHVQGCAAYHFLLLAFIAAMAYAGWIRWTVCMAFLPATVRAFWGMTTKMRLNLRRIGLAEIGVTLLYLVLMIVGFR
jgi:YwiC-like protein